MPQKAIFDSEKTAEILGWAIYRPKNRAKTVSENELREIAELENTERLYIVKRLPELSSAEAELAAEITRRFLESKGKRRETTLKQEMEEHCRNLNIILDERQRQYMPILLHNCVAAAGILSELLQDENLEEIAVTGTGKAKPVFVFDSSFGWLATNIYFSSAEKVKQVANAMASHTGRRITMQKPSLNAVLNDGSRMNACIEPAAFTGPTITIRKFRKSRFTPSELISLGSVGAEEMALLWMAMQSDCSILICGNTGSGKTTLLNSLLNFVPKNERIVSVEETPEIVVPHPHFVKLSTVDGIEIGMQELIVNTLRMRPDRVIVGEVREKGEAKAFMDTILAGQGKGTYATFHAQSALEAVARLRALGILEIDASSIDLIVTQKRWTEKRGANFLERRALVEICEPQIVKGGLSLNRLFSAHGFGKKEKGIARKSSRVKEKICRTFGLAPDGIRKEISKRAEFLNKISGKNWGEYLDEINGYGNSET